MTERLVPKYWTDTEHSVQRKFIPCDSHATMLASHLRIGYHICVEDNI